MNTRTSTRVIVILFLLLSAAPVQAYLTPEQIILQNQTQSLQFDTPVPDTRRTIQEQKKAQEFRRAQEHLLAQDAITKKPDYLHTAPLENVSSTSATTAAAPAAVTATAPGQGQITLDPITLRLLERIERLRTVREAVGELGDLGLTINDGLHGGAPIQKKPLSKTGPAALLSLPLIAGAFLWTLRRVRKAERGCFTSL